MLSGFLRRARIVLRFLWPDADTRAYVDAMRQSGTFDRAFYFASNPRLRKLFCLAPERHYALFGEPTGLCPNPAFSPRAYLHNNPDIADTRALLHFIQSGRAEGRMVLNTTPVAPLALPQVTTPKAPRPYSVVLHLYYHDLWAEFAEILTRQRFPFDLFVTATGSEDQVSGLRSQIQTAFPLAQVLAMPNHGRDIFPFLHLVNHSALSPYHAVCKLHGKASPHRYDGAKWRQALVQGILGNPSLTLNRLESFISDPNAGLWVADGHICEGDEWWGINRDRAQELLQAPPPSPLRFPAGSVYWLKPQVLDALHALKLDAESFEVEQALVDGTTAHAVERLLGIVTGRAGLEMRVSRELDGHL